MAAWMDCTRTLRTGMIQWPDDPVFELRRLADMSRQRGGRFMSVSSESALDWVLFDQLRRRGWVQ